MRSGNSGGGQGAGQRRLCGCVMFLCFYDMYKGGGGLGCDFFGE